MTIKNLGSWPLSSSWFLIYGSCLAPLWVWVGVPNLKPDTKPLYSLSCCRLRVKVRMQEAHDAKIAGLEKSKNKRKRNRKNQKLKRKESPQQLDSSWIELRLPCEATLLDYAAEEEAHRHKDAAKRSKIEEHEKSMASWAEKERKMQEEHDAKIVEHEKSMASWAEKKQKMLEAHDAELEYTEHLVRPFYLFFCLCLLSFVFVFVFVIMSMPWR